MDTMESSVVSTSSRGILRCNKLHGKSNPHRKCKTYLIKMWKQWRGLGRENNREKAISCAQIDFTAASSHLITPRSHSHINALTLKISEVDLLSLRIGLQPTLISWDQKHSMATMRKFNQADGMKLLASLRRNACTMSEKGTGFNYTLLLFLEVCAYLFLVGPPLIYNWNSRYNPSWFLHMCCSAGP